MRHALLVLALLAMPTVAYARTCPATCPSAQAPSVTFYDGQGCLCVPDAATEYVETEMDGVTVRIEGPFTANAPKLVDVIDCADSTVRARSCNEAGCGEWGPNVAGTFPPCFHPVLGESVP